MKPRDKCESVLLIDQEPQDNLQVRIEEGRQFLTSLIERPPNRAVVAAASVFILASGEMDVSILNVEPEFAPSMLRELAGITERIQDFADSAAEPGEVIPFPRH